MKHVRNDTGASKLAFSLRLLSPSYFAHGFASKKDVRACILRVNEDPAVIELLTV